MLHAVFVVAIPRIVAPEKATRIVRTGVAGYLVIRDRARNVSVFEVINMQLLVCAATPTIPFAILVTLVALHRSSRVLPSGIEFIKSPQKSFNVQQKQNSQRNEPTPKMENLCMLVQLVFLRSTPLTLKCGQGQVHFELVDGLIME